MTTRRRFFARMIAIALLLATLLTASPMSVLAGEIIDYIGRGEELGSVVILHDGAEKATVTLNEGEYETLTALCSRGEPDARAWQILDPDTDTWVNISGKNGKTLEVGMALISGALDDAGRAKLRHEIKVNGETLQSEPVEIVVAYRATGAPTLSLPQAEGELTAENTRYMAAADEGGEDGGEDTNVRPLVYIVINYLFDNGGIAAEPTGASIIKGSAFHTGDNPFKSPVVKGYDPYRRVEILDDEGNVISSEYVKAEEISLDIDCLEEDLIINVIYEPALVKYEVHHHFQDLYDDAFSVFPDVVTECYGFTGSQVADNLIEDFPGFYAFDYTRLTIAADGSTVVEIQYEREYYFVHFDMQGGYGTDPVYTRFETPVGANQPIRHGYLFDGWELISYGDAPPSEVQKAELDLNGVGKTIALPAADLTYRARWITQLTTYTMVFWRENIEDNGFTYWGYLDGLSAMSGSLVSGSDRIGEVAGIDDEQYFTYCDVLTDKNVIVEGDGSTVINVYYTRNRYTITFKDKAKCAIPVGHTHSLDDCYTTICRGAHIHSEACNPRLSCMEAEHTAHTDACLICTIPIHTHDASCSCGSEEHTHTKDCWNNVGAAVSKPTRAPTNPVDGQIYRQSSYSRYIYIKGTWYRYNVSAANNDIIATSCKKSEHTHSSACNTCGYTEHTHGDTCYRDALHTHGETCYTYSCGDAAHIHSDACYILNCGIPENHNHTTNTCNSTSYTNTVKIVTRKYQQSIEDIWPIVSDDGSKTYNSGERWEPSADSDLYSNVLVFIANTPSENLTLTMNSSSYSAYTMNYYLEVLPGEAYDVSYGGRNYVLYKQILAKYNYLTYAEDFFPIHGFKQGTSNPAFRNDQVQISSGSKVVDLYYYRLVDQKLEFNNNGTVIDSKTQSGIMYGASLSDQYFVPDYPHNLEVGAFEFGGWYTTSECFPGTEVNWDTLTMPSGDVMLYAYWKPITHRVEIYTELKDGVYVGKIGEDQLVAHNHFALGPEKAPENNSLIFKGWFYYNEEKQKEEAFVFTGIPITQSMKIYAKWSSKIQVDYKINYVLFGTDTPVADPTTGNAKAGENETFQAKVEGQLYAPYQSGYFPLFNSHTVTMSADQSYREFTFEYVYKATMPYAVRYVDANGDPVIGENGEPLQMIKYTDNTRVVVTETFKKAPGMMPDAYQKRLVLSASGDDADNDGIIDSNVITFRYVVDLEHAYYKVVHYIQEIENPGSYREYRSEEVKGEIGELLTFNPITVMGFANNPAKTLVNSAAFTPNADGEVITTLGTDGLLVEFYYDRAEVPYTVKYVEAGTGTELYPAKTGYGLFGSQVVEQGPKLLHLGYTMNAATVEETYKTLHLSTDPEKNIIIFEYTENRCSIEYRIVGDAEGATLSPSTEYVDAVSDDARGSMPYLNKGYKFLGWFYDEACSRPVPAEWVDADGKLTPQKDGVWTSNLVYYARIEPDVSTLTITTEGTAAVDGDQAYIFRIKGVSAAVSDIDFTVTVIGDSSITISDLVIGEYTVTELTDWSFRYEVVNPEKSITMVADGSKNTVYFGQVRSLTKWLDANFDFTHFFE